MLRLKAIPQSDYGAYHALINDPLISYNSGSIPHPVDIEFAAKRLQDRAENERILGDLVQRGAYVGNDLVGDGSLFRSKEGALEIGYCVAETHRGKGYATEMARQLIQLARDHGYMGPIAAGYAKDNPVSGKILEKIGFKCVGEEMNTSAGRTDISAYWRMEHPACEKKQLVSLRPLEEKDIAAVFALQHDREGALLAGVEGEFVPENVFHASMKELIEEGGDKPKIFTVLMADKMAGYIACAASRGGSYQRISYWIARPFWGKGVATAALSELLRKQPKSLLEKGLYAAVTDGNEASVRVLEKFGFIAYKRCQFHSAAHGHEMMQTLFQR